MVNVAGVAGVKVADTLNIGKEEEDNPFSSTVGVAVVVDVVAEDAEVAEVVEFIV